MKIKDLLEMDIGQEFGGDGSDGLLFSIKTFKKTWQVGEFWYSQVILMDETGEMPADVKVGQAYSPLRGQAGGEIRILQAEIQEAEYLSKDRKKLLVDEYSIPTTIGDPPPIDYHKGEDPKIVRGKIKTWYIASKIGQKGSTMDDVVEFAEDERLGLIIDITLEG